MEEVKDKRLRLFIRPEVRLTLLGYDKDYLITKEYGRLIDMESGCWAAALGHDKEWLIRTAAELGYPIHTHHFFDTPLADKAIEAIEDCAGLPVSYAGTFLTSGTEAVSLAVMLSELLTGRKMKLCLNISYLGATPDLRMPRDNEKWTDLDIIDCLNCYEGKCCENCPKLSDLDYSIFAAFVFEPGNSGGMIMFPPEKLINCIAKKVKDSGGFFIANEVTTGVGRTGRFYGYQYYECLNSIELSPDFISMGKNLGNGYPVSCMLTKQEYKDKLEESGFRYVQSHIDDPMGMSVAISTLSVIKNNKLVKLAEEKGEYLRSRLSKIKAIPGTAYSIRGRGLMNVIELNKNIAVRDVFEALLREGYFTGYSEAYNVLRFYPPLTVDYKTIDTFCAAIEKVLQNYHD